MLKKKVTLQKRKIKCPRCGEMGTQTVLYNSKRGLSYLRVVHSHDKICHIGRIGYTTFEEALNMEASDPYLLIYRSQLEDFKDTFELLKIKLSQREKEKKSVSKLLAMLDESINKMFQAKRRKGKPHKVTYS
jgi:ribosomal protein S27AE